MIISYIVLNKYINLKSSPFKVSLFVKMFDQIFVFILAHISSI